MVNRRSSRANFLDLPLQYSSLSGARFVVLPVPYERTTTYGKGTVNGPGAILRASVHVESFDEELLIETYRAGIHTLSPLLTGRLPRERVNRKIYAAVRDILNLEKTPVLLGGEHSITANAIYACKEKYNDLSVLQIDAHADLRDTYYDDRWNHACAMRRVVEIAPLVQVGIRNISKEEYDYAGKSGQINRIYFASNWSDRSIGKAASQLNDKVYVTIDIDGLDPSIAPATGTPEPGGLSWHQLLKLLREISKRKKIIGFDIVELSPIKGFSASEFAAAKLAYRLMGYSVTGKK